MPRRAGSEVVNTKTTSMSPLRIRAVAGAALTLALSTLVSPTMAQYTDKPLGAPGIDLGPSARPSGSLPASGLIPGTPARPPGEYGASTYSPVNPLPNPQPRVDRLPRMIGPQRTPDYQRTRGSGEMTEEQIERFTEYCKTHRKLTRCKPFLEPRKGREPDDE